MNEWSSMDERWIEDAIASLRPIPVYRLQCHGNDIGIIDRTCHRVRSSSIQPCREIEALIACAGVTPESGRRQRNTQAAYPGPACFSDIVLVSSRKSASEAASACLMNTDSSPNFLV